MRFYCIQKGVFRENENDKYVGIDRFVDLQDMFYAEYECGSLPKSLKSMTKDFDNMEFFTHTFRKSKNRPETKKIKILANINDEGVKEEIINHITNIGNRKVSTKGYSWFPSFLENEAGQENKSDFWWSIEDDVMFFVDDENNTNEEKIKIAFANLKVKWADELFPPAPKNRFIEKIKSIFGKKERSVV